MALRSRLLGPVTMKGILIPAVLTGAVNDYEPTGFSSSTIIKLDPGGASRNITGFAAGADGDMKLIMNIATANEDLVLKNANTDSVVANRILGVNGADVTIREQGSCWIVYCGTQSRWCPVAI